MDCLPTASDSIQPAAQKCRQNARIQVIHDRVFYLVSMVGLYAFYAGLSSGTWLKNDTTTPPTKPTPMLPQANVRVNASAIVAIDAV